MKRRCSRFLAGLLAAVMVVSSGGLEVAARRSVGQWAEVDAEDGKNLDTNSKAEEDSDSNEDAKDSTTSEEGQKDDSSTSDEENKESNESSVGDETDNMPDETPQKEDPAKEEDKKEDSDKTDTSDQDLEDKDVLDKNSDERMLRIRTQSRILRILTSLQKRRKIQKHFQQRKNLKWKNPRREQPQSLQIL